MNKFFYQQHLTFPTFFEARYRQNELSKGICSLLAAGVSQELSCQENSEFHPHEKGHAAK